MSYHAKLLVAAALAGGLLYGRFTLPPLLSADSRDDALLELRDENERLRCQNEELRNSNTQLLRKVTHQYSFLPRDLERTGSFPPDEELRGRIRKADSERGLFTIDLGSDSGLKRGHTLAVYRLTVVGTLRVAEVRPNTAAAVFINGGDGVQVGDQVFGRADEDGK